MAKVIRTRNAHQSHIVKLLNGMTGRFSLWNIWQDFITMAAVSISNVLQNPHSAEREKMYERCASKYSVQELTTFAEILAEVAQSMEEYPDQDFLGELFMALGLGNEWAGQFFTPYSVCRAMSAMTIDNNIEERIAKQGWVSVNDPACGAGALLIAYANECKERGINFQTSVLFVAQDIDTVAGLMCYIQLSLMGCPGYVVIQNTLTNPSTSFDARGLLPHDNPNVWYTQFYNSPIWQGRRFASQMDLLFKSTSPPLTKPQEPIIETPLDNNDIKIAETTSQLTLF